MTGDKCAEFGIDNWGVDRPVWETLMRCPACKGWLPQDWPIGKQFKCKKCGATLETLPSIPETYTQPNGKTHTEEEDADYEWGGRLCVVPDMTIKINPKGRANK